MVRCEERETALKTPPLGASRSRSEAIARGESVSPVRRRAHQHMVNELLIQSLGIAEDEAHSMLMDAYGAEVADGELDSLIK